MDRTSALLCALVAALCATAFAPPAGASAAARTSVAAKFPATGGAMQTAMRTAHAFWGREACNGAVAVRWAPLPEGTVAQAEWMSFPGAVAPAFFDCAIVFNEDAELTARELCAAAVHEVGHLHGLGHEDDDAHPVMGAFYAGTPAACVRAMAPFMAKRKVVKRKRSATARAVTARR